MTATAENSLLDTRRLQALETGQAELRAAVKEMADAIRQFATSEIRQQERSARIQEEFTRLIRTLETVERGHRELESDHHRWLNRAWGIWAVIGTLGASAGYIGYSGITGAASQLSAHELRLQRLEIKTGLTSSGAMTKTHYGPWKPAPLPPDPTRPPEPVVIPVGRP